LIADDDEPFRESTGELLCDRGFDCRCVSDAHAALEVLTSGWGAVVVADINMPGNSDLEFLAQLREQECDAAVILVTGYPSFGTAVNSLNLGVTGYLVKPFALEDLLNLVRKSLQEVRALRRIGNMSQRLQQMSSDISTLARLRPGAFRRELNQSNRLVLDLAFDGIIGILLDLKEEMLRTDSPTLTPGDEVAHEPRFAALAETIFNSSPELKSLSPREREVLIHLVSGDRVATIARELFISENTVRNHLKSIFGKLEVRSQVELLERFRDGSHR